MKIMKKISVITYAILLANIFVATSCKGVPEETSEMATVENAFSVEEVLEMVSVENDITRTLSLIANWYEEV